MPDAAMVGQHTAMIVASTEDEGLGWDVDWAGDLNADGIDDIVIASSNETGMVRVFFGGGT